LGTEQFNHPLGNLAFIATTLVGLFPIARQSLRLIKSGSWFAIETLMSVAAIGAPLSARRRKRRWYCCCF
jgi:Cd2+/Zn2+-exporting ATPase